MDADEMKRYIRDTFPGSTLAEANGDAFVTYDPDGDLPADRWLPFATIVTGGGYDTVSNLGEGAYRLDIGLPRQTYIRHLGPPPTTRDADGVLVTGADHTAGDTLMPHPHYGNQHWAAVVDPGEKTLHTAKELLADAYDFAVRRHTNHRARESPGQK